MVNKFTKAQKMMNIVTVKHSEIVMKHSDNEYVTEVDEITDVKGSEDGDSDGDDDVNDED